MLKQLRASGGVFIIVIFITLLMCPKLYAVEETQPTPEEIIAKNIEAIGGMKALKKIKNKKIATIRKNVQMNMESKCIEYRERPNNYFLSYNTGVSAGVNGKVAWEITPVGPHLFEGDRLSIALNGNRFDGPDGPDARYKSMKTEGIEKINGKECYKVVKIPEIGNERIVYYDKKSYMIIKTTNNMQENNKSETYIEEYKKINGIQFPHKIVFFINGQKNSEITTEKIELNIEMPEGIFDIPEEIKAVMNKKTQKGDDL